MKVAAIYARKSTGQHVADEAKSTKRQTDNARAFAAHQGWTVDDRFVFVDEGISGAETKRLLQRQRMIDAATNREFDVVIMQAQDRFSRRDGHVAFTELEQLARHVEVWFYAEAKRFTSGTFESNITGILKSEFAAEYRRAIAAKTHEALRRRAELGKVTGGKTFGYDNVKRNGYVDRAVNPKEAAVVKEIYRRYADGEGFKQIAHALNAKKLPSPRPQRGRPAGWDPGTIRAVLKRPLYRGVIMYDRTKKRAPDGTRHPGRQPKKDRSLWLAKPWPEFRLIDPKVAEQVDKRLNERRSAYLRDHKGRLLGSPRGHGHKPAKHLLAGFLVCECGASFEAVQGYYVCSARRRKGPDVCPSELSFPVEAVENVFLSALESVVLAPTFIDRLLDATFAAATHADVERQQLVQEQERLTREIENLTKGIASGGDIPALAVALAERDKRLQVVAAKLARPDVLPDRKVLKDALELRTADWRGILRSQHVAQARTVLQHLLDLPIRVFNAPKPKWVAAAKPEGLGIGLIQSVASPTGFEPVF